MNRFKIRLPAPAIRVTILGFLALMATALSSCGAGQISQTATQEPAVNGNQITLNNLALRNIRIQVTQTGAFLQPGRTVDLVLVAINESPDVTDRLASVSSDIGTVALRGDTRLPANGTLFIGTPEDQQITPAPLGSSNTARATVTLAKPITNGLTYNFTFNFEKAGPASVTVPISVGLTPQHL
ncbi:hypothetical protein MUBE_06485 [Mycobacterium uberis]|uniref:Lipoprotein LpqE n=1 Tax=Mycobacterium uberis TaxID=2162698 RepID=A0A3E1HHZ1_9MYCO|nr:hypothetical protein [Mycobacterium uberis]RFD26073.1 hypothetical protein MUBE_06485 [Mycobacterium uberis]